MVLKKIVLHIRTTLIAGLLAILPIGVTIFVLKFFFELLDPLLGPILNMGNVQIFPGTLPSNSSAGWLRMVANLVVQFWVFDTVFLSGPATFFEGVGFADKGLTDLLQCQMSNI